MSILSTDRVARNYAHAHFHLLPWRVTKYVLKFESQMQHCLAVFIPNSPGIFLFINTLQQLWKLPLLYVCACWCVNARVCVCVCVCARARERECVCERESLRKKKLAEREKETVFVFAPWVCICVSVCVCVNV